MTLLQVKNQLITFFFGHHTFEFKKHQLEIEFDKESADFRAPLIQEALADLEKLGIVRKMVVNKDDALAERESWILTQPIHSFTQNVMIGPLVAERVANAINFVNGMEGIDIVCDKMKLDERDIFRLVDIVEEMIEEVAEDSKDTPKVPGEDEEKD